MGPNLFFKVAFTEGVKILGGHPYYICLVTGVVVEQVKATDADYGANAEISYRIQSGNEGGGGQKATSL